MESDTKQRKKGGKPSEKVPAEETKAVEKNKRLQQEVENEPEKVNGIKAVEESSNSKNSKNPYNIKLLNGSPSSSSSVAAESIRSLSLPPITINVEYDLFTLTLFILAFATRTFKLWSPNDVV